jgi:hypothetical protein
MVNVKDWTEIERLVRSTTDNGDGLKVLCVRHAPL